MVSGEIGNVASDQCAGNRQPDVGPRAGAHHLDVFADRRVRSLDLGEFSRRSTAENDALQRVERCEAYAERVSLASGAPACPGTVPRDPEKWAGCADESHLRVRIEVAQVPRIQRRLSSTAISSTGTGTPRKLAVARPARWMSIGSVTSPPPKAGRAAPPHSSPCRRCGGGSRRSVPVEARQPAAEVLGKRIADRVRVAETLRSTISKEAKQARRIRSPRY